jgi:ERCC4-related helicase
MLPLLQIYLHTIKLNELLPRPHALAYMKNNFESLVVAQHQEHDFNDLYNGNNLTKCLLKSNYFLEKREQFDALAKKDKGENKEILVKLIEILTKEYTANPNTRTLIFAETRQFTLYLSDYLNRKRELCSLIGESKASYLTSSNQSSKAGGMSAEQQKRVIRSFDDGKISNYLFY